MGYDRKTYATKIDDKPKISNYQKGLDMQRERFKESKFSGDFDAMADALENIKSEIKSKMLANHHNEKLIQIEQILADYRNKEKKYLKRTPRGYKTIFPRDMPIRINVELTKCFELLISELDVLGLL